MLYSKFFFAVINNCEGINGNVKKLTLNLILYNKKNLLKYITILKFDWKIMLNVYNT
jgi:hypothetical protein